VWNVLLVGIDSIEKTENAEIEVVNGSTIMKVNAETTSLRIHLK